MLSLTNLVLGARLTKVRKTHSGKYVTKIDGRMFVEQSIEKWGQHCVKLWELGGGSRQSKVDAHLLLLSKLLKPTFGLEHVESNT